MPIDPSILDEAGRVAYDDTLTIEEREERLELLAEEERELRGSVAGYMEMLPMLRMALENDESIPRPSRALARRRACG